jgi:hypothetical protein
MNQTFRAGAPLRRIATRTLLAATVVATLATAYAFKTIFARPGEAAFRYVPSDAVLVASIDLSPSPQQTLAFKRIDDALERNDMGRFAEGNVLNIFTKPSPASEALQPLILRNGAVVALPYKDGKDDLVGLAFLALTDGTAAEAILKKYGKPVFFRGTKGYALKGDQGAMMVMDDLLVLGEVPYSLHRARMVREGMAQSILTNSDFVAAREKLASDANAMVLVSPKMLEKANVKALQSAKASWLAAGLAIRDGGIGLSLWNQWDPSSLKAFNEMAKTNAIRRDLFTVLPTGAYGMFVVSQPANYFDTFEKVAEDQPDGSKAVKEMAEATEKNLGMDLHKELLAGLRGNAVVAAYPAGEGAAEGADLLLVVDDSNGSDPAAAVDQFQAYVDEQMRKEGGSEALWVSTGDHRFRLSEKVQEDMRKGMGEGMDPSAVNKDVLVGKKTVAWAMVGKAVVASTNEDLLKRAIESYKAHTNPLSGDASFLKSDAEVMDGSQVLAIFNLARISQGVKNTVKTDKMDKDGKEMFESVVAALSSLTDPFYLKAKVSPDGQVSTGAFIPLDYDRVLDFVGKQMKK